MGILCPRGTGSIPVVASYLVWDGGQWLDSVSSARVDPALNGYLKRSGEGKHERCVKAQDGWPPTPHCTSWLKGHKTEVSTASLDLKGLVPSYLLTLLTTSNYSDDFLQISIYSPCDTSIKLARLTSYPG